MAETDLVKLYSKKILELTTQNPHAERLVAPDATASKRSPLCGSAVTVDVAVAPEDGRLADLGMDVKACALGQASAAILARAGVGKSAEDLGAARDALKAMLKEGAAAPSGDFAELEVLTPARDYKNRHASILLAWEAVVEALQTAKAERAAAI
ncbi:MAG: iron-sulfur cluster assembly scaffold protein [Pseudomonadota bacterium]